MSLNASRVITFPSRLILLGYRDTYINSLPIIMFHGGNAHLVSSYVNVGKFTEWWVRPNYFSISTSSIWMIIIPVTYFDESGDSPTATSANGNILSLRVRIHWVYILQSTLESAIFESFIIYLFVLLKKTFYMKIVYSSSGSWYCGICFNINLRWLELTFM